MLSPIMNDKNLECFAYTNRNHIQGQPKGIIVDFFGLNGMAMFDDNHPYGKTLAQKNILLVIPYNNTWAWMNPQAVAYTDEIMDVLLAHYGLDELPIVATGGSMGGMSAIVYCRYAKRTPVACITNCPVCDLPYHFTERPDLPRTLYSAFWHENGKIEDTLARFSPCHLVGTLPQIPYTIYHCECDRAVNIERHSEKLVEKMTDAGYSVCFIRVPGRDHCDLPQEIAENYREDAISAILNR